MTDILYTVFVQILDEWKLSVVVNRDEYVEVIGVNFLSVEQRKTPKEMISIG